MSNTITIKDPNGNIVCSVENVDPVKSEEGVFETFFKGLALGFSTIVAGITGFYALLALIVIIAVGVCGAKEKIDANYAKKILKRLDINYVNELKKELKQIVEDENRIVSEIANDVKSYAMKNKDIKTNCKEIYVSYDSGLIESKKEIEKLINGRLVGIVNSIKKQQDDVIAKLGAKYEYDFIELSFTDISSDWYYQTKDAVNDLKDYLKTFASNKKYSSKYVDSVSVNFDTCDSEQDIFWFSFEISFNVNKDETEKLLKPIIDAINS